MVRTPRRWNPFIVRQGFSHPMDFVMHKTKTDQISSTVPFRKPYIAPVHAQRIGHQLHQTYTAVGVPTEDATPVVAWILRDNIQKLTVSARETGSGRPLEDDGSIPNNRRSRSEDAAQPEETTNEQDNAAEATQDRILDRASAKRIRQERDDVDRHSDVLDMTDKTKEPSKLFPTSSNFIQVFSIFELIFRKPEGTRRSQKERQTSYLQNLIFQKRFQKN